MQGNFTASLPLIKAGADHQEGGDQRGSPLVAAKPEPVWSQQLKQSFAYNRNQYLKYWQLYLKQNKTTNLN